MASYKDVLKMPTNIEETTLATLNFFNDNYRDISPEILENRKKIKRYIEKFHSEAGTLTSKVSDKIDLLDKEKNYPVLMAAHQPNFIPYGGVVRKATLLHVLDKELKELTSNPNIEFFGIADQDISQSWRWQRESQLPSIRKKNGYLSLFYDFPEEYDNKLFCSVPKPSKEDVDGWKEDIENWINEEINKIEKVNNNKISYGQKRQLYENFDRFTDLLDSAYKHSTNFADFNAFLLSEIVNKKWGYDTLFTRFSECQQIFEHEFAFLLYHYKDFYNSLNKTKLEIEGKTAEKMAPFWYHCDCNGKISLSVYDENEKQISVGGKCPECKEYVEFEFDRDELKNGFGMKDIISRISARARAMPLIIFNGLGVSCYVGGLGGSKKYSAESKIIANNLKQKFPVYVAWLPHDYYAGLGQLDAFLTLKSACNGSRINLKKSLDKVQSKIVTLSSESEKKKDRLRKQIKKENREEIIREIKKLDSEYRKKELSLKAYLASLKKVPTALGLRPSIADYIINIGLEETNRQWIKYLEGNGKLTEDLYLDSIFGKNEELFELVREDGLLVKGDKNGR